MPARTLRGLIGSCLSLSLCVLAFAADDHPASRPPVPPPTTAPAVETPATGSTEAILTEPSTIFVDAGSRGGRLYVVGEAIFLDRNTPDVLISQSNGTATVVGGRSSGIAALSGEDLNFEMQAGSRITLGYQYDSSHAVEGTFTGFLDWNSKATGVGQPNAAAPLTDLDAGFLSIFPAFSGAATHTAKYSSSLNMVEVNHISRVGQRGTFLVGARYVDLEEDYQLTAANLLFVQQGEFDLKTRNYMVGPLVGGTYERSYGKLALEDSAKLGVLGNFFDVGANVVNSNFPLAINDHEQEVSLGAVVDLGLTLRYHVSDRLSVHGGYQVLGIYGAALAIDQKWDSTDVGDVVYHGPNVGLEWRR